MANLKRIQEASQERMNNLKQIIDEPRNVRESVQKATQYVADELAVCGSLERIKNLLQKADELVESADNEAILNSEVEELQKTLRQLKARHVQKKVLVDIGKILSNLAQSRKGLSTEDRKNQDIRLLIHQQKRLILRRFIDQSADRSIRVFDADQFELNLPIRLDLFNYLGDKE